MLARDDVERGSMSGAKVGNLYLHKCDTCQNEIVTVGTPNKKWRLIGVGILFETNLHLQSVFLPKRLCAV